MSQTKDQIEAHRDRARSDLNSNLRELEERAVSAMDWKQQFKKNPGTLLAVAFGAGIAVSLFAGGGGRKRRRDGVPISAQSYGPRGDSELWGKVKSALIGVVAARVSDYAGHLFPGTETLRQPVRERFPSASGPGKTGN